MCSFELLFQSTPPSDFLSTGQAVLVISHYYLTHTHTHMNSQNLISCQFKLQCTLSDINNEAHLTLQPVLCYQFVFSYSTYSLLYKNN